MALSPDKPRLPPPPAKASDSFAPFGGPPGDVHQRALERTFAELARRPIRRKAGILLRIVRTSMLLGILTSIGVGSLGYQWLSELQVFDIREEQLDAIVKNRTQDNSVVYDREGEKIGEFFNSYAVYVPYNKLPKHLIDAIVAIEDRTFWTHKGFDPKGMARAAVSFVRGDRQKQGASTLTQQIVRNFLLPTEKSLNRKVQEIAFAIHLERKLTKERLIEIYANRLFLGNGSYGVGAAAFRYFGKAVTDLEPQETALIAGLFQSPSRFNPVRYPERAKKRQIQVLKAMYKAKMIPVARAKELAKVPLEYREYKPLNTEVAPYFVDFVRDQATKLLAEKKIKVDGQGLRIYTTIDQKLQKMAEEAVAESDDTLEKASERTQKIRTKDGEVTNATIEAALLTVDPSNGEILAMVGGRDYAKTKFNRTWQAHRSPGSLFKPVVYSLALQNKWKWSDMIYVSPITVNNYRPHTPDEDMLTETTMMRAFYRSMNTPTVELGEKLGLKKIIEQAGRLGIRSPIKEEFGSTLGSSDATMLDLARMYGVFANEGRLVEQVAITKITDRKGKVVYKAPEVDERTTQAVTPQIAYLMMQGMRAVLAMGTGYTSARLANIAAGKTGTSNDSTDNWFGGYTPNLETIVWVGTDEHASIHGDTTGAKLALPIWDRFMNKALAVRKPPPFRAPPNIVTTLVHPKFGNRSASGVRMYFLRGQEPPEDGSELEALTASGDEGFRDVFSH